MLVLTRRIGEEIVIGENIHLAVVRIEGGKVRLGVVAPRTVRVEREESRERRPSAIVQTAGNAVAAK